MGQTIDEKLIGPTCRSGVLQPATKTYFDKTNCGRSWKSEKIVYKCNTEFKLNLPDLPRIITYSRKCPIIHTGVTGQSLTNFEKFDKFSKCDRFDYQCCQKLIKH